jgi:hypothetical protein
VQEVNAHHHMAYACVTYLLTSHCIIGSQISADDQVLRVAKGFHGLHPYAHEFWFKHVIRYADIQQGSKLRISSKLAEQLQRLDVFRKGTFSVAFQTTLSDQKLVLEIGNRLSSLNHAPKTQNLIRDILIFQEMAAREGDPQRTPQGNSKKYIYGLV